MIPLNFSKKHEQVDLFWVNFDSISAMIPFLPPTGIKYKNKNGIFEVVFAFQNGPPFLRFGGFQKRVAIFFLVFGSQLERGTRDKNKNAIFVSVFDVPIGMTKEYSFQSQSVHRLQSRCHNI